MAHNACAFVYCALCIVLYRPFTLNVGAVASPVHEVTPSIHAVFGVFLFSYSQARSLE